MTPTTYIVDGMTCQHCVASVSEEVSEVAGVERADFARTTRRDDVLTEVQALEDADVPRAGDEGADAGVGEARLE